MEGDGTSPGPLRRPHGARRVTDCHLSRVHDDTLTVFGVLTGPAGPQDRRRVRPPAPQAVSPRMVWVPSTLSPPGSTPRTRPLSALPRTLRVRPVSSLSARGRPQGSPFLTHAAGPRRALRESVRRASRRDLADPDLSRAPPADSRTGCRGLSGAWVEPAAEPPRRALVPLSLDVGRQGRTDAAGQRTVAARGRGEGRRQRHRSRA